MFWNGLSVKESILTIFQEFSWRFAIMRKLNCDIIIFNLKVSNRLKDIQNKLTKIVVIGVCFKHHFIIT